MAKNQNFLKETGLYGFKSFYYNIICTHPYKSHCTQLPHTNLLFQVQCDFNPRIFVLATFMDVTYLILFINFFLQAYVFNGGKAKYKKSGEKNGVTNGVHHQNGVKANGDSKKHN